LIKERDISSKYIIYSF